MTAPTESMKQPPAWSALISRIQDERHAARSSPAVIAGKHAVHASTEHLAYSITERYTAQLNPEQRIGLRRAVGICAIHADARPGELSLGTSLALMHVKDRGHQPGSGESNSITMQVDALPMLDIEAAAQVLDLFVGRCADEGVPVNFHDLARTLMAWGNGITDRSKAARARVVRDFYTSNTD